MIIGPTSPLGGTSPIDPSNNIRPIDPKDSLPPIQDKVEVSEAARLSSEALAIEPLRMDKIQDLKMQIQAGTFDTTERLERALQKFLETL
jgi:hypothetical protein